ncbi:uncharacterized protein METZ01_LOCUS120809 [marine metagenome]|uniref:DUF1501 domain-containing protein n=1 Tax=marine metagenome TaxID=408172 RepID=A0A381XTD0_9ZZZZ
MIRITSNDLASTCEGVSRREFLRIGALGLGGLTLPRMLAVAGEATSVVRDKAVVVLNLQGGPSQVETFDPKMTAPREYRAMFGEVKTSLPGITFGAQFPMLAKLANKMAVVRSYRHGISSHGPAALHVAAGGNPTKACMASLYARVAGITNPRTGLPNNTIVIPAAISPDYKDLSAVPQRVTDTGTLPPAYKAFDPSKGSTLLEDMKLNLPAGRFDDRKSLLREFDQLRRRVDSQIENTSTFEQQAMNIVLRGMSAAFDLSKEDPRTLARYDTGAIKPDAGTMKRNSYAKQFSPVALGKQMLMARRLVEAGCGFVTVTCTGWDMHGGGKEYTITDGMPVQAPAVDRAASAFIEDIIQRGLYEKVLLVITGEFGRTPKINAKGGRDHWGNLCTLAFAGGGLKMGQIIGASNKTVSEPARDQVSSSQLLGTVMHTLLDIPNLRLRNNFPAEIQRVITNSQPIKQLI